MLRRFSAFLLSFFFCLTLLVPSALADDGFTSSGGSDFDNDYGVRWSGFVDDGSSTGVFVKAPDMWAAAVYACGGNPGLLSAEVRSKLSDPNYGGRFYAYAQSFGHIMSVSEIPGWVPLYILAAEGISNVWHGDFGDMWLWFSKVPNSLISGALIDFRLVLSGEDLSGGSGSPSASFPPGDYYEIDTSDAAMYPYPAGREVNKIYLSVDFVDAYLAQFANASPARNLYVYVRTDSKGTHAGVDCVSAWSLSGSPNWYISFSQIWYMSSGMQWFLDDDNNWYYAYLDGQPLAYTGNGINSAGFDSSLGHYHFACDFSRDFPIVRIGEPGGDWPDNPVPVTPDPPDIPLPAEPTVTPEPTVTTPTPTWPNINITVNPPAVVAPVTPDGLDYTELLTRINDNLNSINSYVVAVNSSLNSLRSDLVTEFGSVVQSLRNIYGYLQHMDSVLEVHCVHIRNKIEESAVFIANYMRSLVHWLAEQLDYDDTYGTDSYDDSLLTTINEKLGGGTYEPNPIKDELGYYEWLDDLWERFLLGDDWQSSASSISASFGLLRTRFPFSIPWDIVALFRLFVHEPVTPVFDLPLYFSGSSSTPVRVDLTPWDGVASVVRPLIYVIFALKLALLSRDLLAGLGADKGGLS